MPLKKHHTTAVIISNEPISERYFCMTVECKILATDAAPGQFIMIECGNEVFLKRPMGISDANDATGTISFIYQICGKGTRALAEQKIGRELKIIGPLGNKFLVHKNAQSLALVGGGTGIGPLLFCAKKFYTDYPNIALYGFIGARTKNILCGIDEMRGFTKETHITTDDDSYGQKAVATDALFSFLEKKSVDQIISCGPTAMMKKTAEIATKRAIPCQVSLEEYMACGFGACLGCPCEIKNEGYKMICLEGPVFDAEKVVW
jgi:dihydroorotate dehydrogenase electron transfer subunit